MKICVQKFGGTSVADCQKIQSVADEIIRTKQRGFSVVVVVSAMGDSTDKLVKLAQNIGGDENSAAMAMLLSSGEQVSAALLAMALQKKGVKAKALTGGQSGIFTDSSYTNATIVNIDTTALSALLKQGITPVVTGFQGIDSTGSITTLGRGGSDTSATSIAAALQADRCDIYTDVCGVYTTDPRFVSSAQKIMQISYQQMYEFAAAGASVLHPKAVLAAQKGRIPVIIRSSFNLNDEGTLIDEKPLNRQIIGVVLNHQQGQNILSVIGTGLDKCQSQIEQFLHACCDIRLCDKNDMRLSYHIFTDNDTEVLKVLHNHLFG